jgi:dihydropteroate synthase
MYWQCRNRKLECGVRPAIMGILNVTPDSFSDGGRFTDTAAAVAAARQMVEDGADIIDVGGESTRPGAAAVDTAEELRRVIPVIEAIVTETDALVSVDTMKADVAREGMRHGAHIINDVSALTHDAAMADVAGEFGAGVVLMHMQGSPRTMQSDPQYGDVVSEIRCYLEARVSTVVEAGLARETLAIDPGVGFGKTAEHNVLLVAHLAQFASLGQPVLVGLSRKRFLGMLTGAPVEDRLAGSLAGLACSVLHGAHIMRVHDVKESAQAARIAAAIRGPEYTHTVMESATC